MTDATKSSGEEWRRSWPVVLAAAAGMALSTANVYSTGIFMGPLQDAFGWSRTQISAGLLIGSVALGSDKRLRVILAADYERLQFLRVLRSHQAEPITDSGALLVPEPPQPLPPGFQGPMQPALGGPNG
jgi:hypothetical protein